MQMRLSTRQLNNVSIAPFLVAAALLMPSAAMGDDVPDTVMLTNGGRIRGTVTEEDPQNGVVIRLVDGTFRKLTAKEVKEVQYGSSAPSNVTPQPVYQAQPPGIAYSGMTLAPKMVLGPNGYMLMVPAGSQPMVHQNSGMFGGGLALTIIGAIALPSGLITAIAGALPVGGCRSGSDTTDCYAGGVLIGLGVLGLAVGIPMTVIGGKKVPADSVARGGPWWQPTSFGLSPIGSRVEWAF